MSRAAANRGGSEPSTTSKLGSGFGPIDAPNSRQGLNDGLLSSGGGVGSLGGEMALASRLWATEGALPHSLQTATLTPTAA